MLGVHSRHTWSHLIEAKMVLYNSVKIIKCYVFFLNVFITVVTFGLSLNLVSRLPGVSSLWTQLGAQTAAALCALQLPASQQKQITCSVGEILRLCTLQDGPPDAGRKGPRQAVMETPTCFHLLAALGDWLRSSQRPLPGKSLSLCGRAIC